VVFVFGDGREFFERAEAMLGGEGFALPPVAGPVKLDTLIVPFQTPEVGRTVLLECLAQ